MRANALHTVQHKRKYIRTTDSKHDLPIARNILARQFNPQQTNQAWAADITYIDANNMRAYCAVVLDLCFIKPVGWAIS